jgi:hypothetical protein
MKRQNFTSLKKGGTNKPGPKRSFSEEDLRAVEFLSKLGATDKQFADYFQLKSVSTVERWMNVYPEFRAARKRGGIEADMAVVQSLYKRAVGFEYIEEEYVAIEYDGKKMPLNQMRLAKRTKKYVVPDVKAQLRWLTARQRQQWAIVPEAVLRHTGDVNHLHRKIEDIPVQELTPEQQKLLFGITQKQLSVNNSHDN